MDVLFTTHKDCIAQLHNLLLQLDNAAFCRPLSLLSGSTLGQHTRHIVEFYECLKGALEQKIPVNYDARARKKQWESDVDSVLERLPLYLTCFEHNDCPLQFCSTLNGTEQCLLYTSTTLYRELVVLIEHTTHHLAIMKMAIQHHFPHLKTPYMLGVAYSTRQYWDEVGR